jgi:ornithine decarboxylase
MMDFSKKICINEKSRIYDLTNFDCNCKEWKIFELAKRIIKDPLVSKKLHLIVLIILEYFSLKKKNVEQDPFFIADLNEIYLRYCQWKDKFPRVEPLYAVKSNYDYYVIKLMSSLGVDFDCSSKGEIDTLIRLKITTNRILFANPNKQISHIKYSKLIGVNKLVFDNENELLKIHSHHNNAECILRIKSESAPLKFGADLNESIKLIAMAIRLEINLIGISFYVGFRQKNAKNIVESIKNSRYLFDFAREKFNYKMHLLDIGGGFPGKEYFFFI